MRGLWYGDRRDRVKWGGLIHLAKTYKILQILQIAYLRDGKKMELIVGNMKETFSLAEEVWRHFSDLQGIRRLGEVVGINIEVRAGVFDPEKRDEYVEATVAELKATPRPLIAFLDPDTGLSPTKKAKPEHVAWSDLEKIWEALEEDDVLAVYQHGDRTSSWIESRRKLFSERVGAPCQAIIGKEIAGDVALLWCQRSAHWHDQGRPARSRNPAREERSRGHSGRTILIISPPRAAACGLRCPGSVLPACWAGCSGLLTLFPGGPQSFA